MNGSKEKRPKQGDKEGTGLSSVLCRGDDEGCWLGRAEGQNHGCEPGAEVRH